MLHLGAARMAWLVVRLPLQATQAEFYTQVRDCALGYRALGFQALKLSEALSHSKQRALRPPCIVSQLHIVVAMPPAAFIGTLQCCMPHILMTVQQLSNS
jgi:hypothetical protein